MHQSIINVVLVAPEIPQNTGNIIRLCSNVGARLHLVEPLGFQLDDTSLRRAALDYRDMTEVMVHDSIDMVFDSVDIEQVYAAMIDGQTPYTEPRYRLGDTIVFGSESIGLSVDVSSRLNPANKIRIPMVPANRSINLSNAVAIIVYEVWKQIGFPGSDQVLSASESYYS